MRLLAIVSGDYGELGTAMYFLQGLRLPESQVLMLPASLRYTQVSLPGVDVRVYSGLGDIRRAIAETRPDTVILASGYLLPINSGLSLLDSLRLLRALHAAGITVLTSDPFVGLLRIRALDFRDVQERGRNRRSAFAASWRYAMALFPVRLMLRRAWHIYPVPLEGLRPAREVRRLSYCNPATVDVPAPDPVDGRSRPMWLFVLSKTDLALQLRAHGDRFAELVADRLRDCVELGRSALLIAPDDLVAAVRPLLGDRPGISLRSEIAYADYQRNLMEAQHVFFWNFLSFSIIHRVLAQRPVFFFHEGHMVHILPALWKEGIGVVYGGWMPPLLSIDARLDEADLSGRAAEVTRQFRRIGDGLRRCRPPEEILRVAAERPQP